MANNYPPGVTGGEDQVTGARPKRGGSDSAREKKQTGIVVHISREERVRVGIAAARADMKVKAFAAAALMAAVEKSEKYSDKP